MAEVVMQEESLDCLLFVSLYCKHYRQDNGFWEQAFDFFMSNHELREDKDMNPDCYEEHHSGDFIPNCEERETSQTGKMKYGKGNSYDGFFIVSNRGCIFGNHDHKQRI